MRETDREILEEAIRNSGMGEDFDEMLLRAIKRQLPRSYHRQFSVILGEIIEEADALGTGNRAAAQSLLRKGAAVTDAPGRPLPAPPASLPPIEVAQPGPVTGRPAAVAPPATAPAPTAEPAGSETTGEPSGGSVERLPEEQRILDLGGTSPESLSPEMRDKLSKLVKAQKRRQEWQEDQSAEEPDPGLFFKGQQRVPPTFVPLGKPPKKERPDTGTEGKGEGTEEEEDLD